MISVVLELAKVALISLVENVLEVLALVELVVVLKSAMVVLILLVKKVLEVLVLVEMEDW